MTLQVIRGESKNRTQAELLAAKLGQLGAEGDLYLGYPVLSTADDRVQVDALLASAEHGVVAFQIAEFPPQNVVDWRNVVASQNRLFAVLESQLGRHQALRKGRRLAFDVHTVTVFPVPPGDAPAGVDTEEGVYCGIDDLGDRLAAMEAVPDSLMVQIQSALQRVSTLRPSNRRSNVQTAGSRGAILKEIEKSIANLDRWQNWAAIEMPEGPQRIRGLAGSGKTIVLALKASYLHAQNPDWKIAVTFQSRALYQQLNDLITRFSFEHVQDAPDFTQLNIMHAWGGAKPGVYTTIAAHLGFTPVDFRYANDKYGMERAFQGACAEMLRVVEAMPSITPLFDAVLIDEAQDLPPEFFRLVYLLTKDPKRVVFGYDELQKLSDSAMPTPAEMFGVDENGDPLESLSDVSGKAKADIVLPTCYRNSHWSLAVAHGLGYGVYREDGLVQHFAEPQLWADVGYEVVKGKLELGEAVTLQRSKRSTPEYFEQLLKAEDAIVVQSFDVAQAQDEWVAEQIRINVTDDELQPTDILVVFPLSRTTKSRSASLRAALDRRGVASHLVGVTSSVDQMRVDGSVAMAHIHRAKGNEAAMVYVMDSQIAAATHDSRTPRNTLFTAITRNKAWVRICGFGSRMDVITEEIKKIRDHDYQLQFTLPTKRQLAAFQRGDNGAFKRDAEFVRKSNKSLVEVVNALDSGELEIDDLPVDVRRDLLKRLQLPLFEDDDDNS